MFSSVDKTSDQGPEEDEHGDVEEGQKGAMAAKDMAIEEDDDQGQDKKQKGAKRVKKPSLELIQGENSKRLIQFFEAGKN